MPLPHLGADTDGDVVEERLRKLLFDRNHVRRIQIGAQQPHTTVDVEAHASRADNSFGIVNVKRRHVANGEPVARVDVGKSNRMLQQSVI